MTEPLQTFAEKNGMSQINTDIKACWTLPALVFVSILSNEFYVVNTFRPNKISLEYVPCLQLTIGHIGLGNVLVPTRQQAIAWKVESE